MAEPKRHMDVPQERVLENPPRKPAGTRSPITSKKSEHQMTSLLSNPEFWQYLSIPVIAALIGW
ncbi:MAG: hypothetical protein R3198_14785, partial [Marinobacter sp.]|nr:hypothetical protein [Marinobacter sp.]